jgi:signal transduction histidine kinase/CheY-like chemotaxis protein
VKAQEIDLDRILVRKPAEGTLELRGSRALLTDAAATYRLAEELEETLGHEASRGVLTRFGYQSGYQEAARLRTYFDWESDIEWLLAGARTQALLGIGQVSFEDVIVDRAQGLFRVVAVVRNSFEACERKKRRGPATSACCDRLTGYFSGFGSAFAGDEVIFVEQACAGTSDTMDTCRIEGRLKSEWGAEGEKHAALYQQDAIGERLAVKSRAVLDQAVKIKEQELALEATRKVEEANRLKTEFLANISHELRTPLNAILGYGDLLIGKLGPKLPAQPLQNLERIVSNAEHLLGLINSILDISKVEAGRMEVHLEPVDAREIIDRCAEDARILLRGKPVELTVAYKGNEVPRIQADRTKLKQCVTNVLANAARFTEQGSIRIEVRVISGHRSGRSQGFLAIAVADTGPGIAPEHHAMIFEPFRQVDASATRTHGGTGLGLAIVRKLLGLMGGEIQLSSTPGVGSTFTIVVPVALESAAYKTSKPVAPAAPPEGEILVIDDDPGYAELMRQILVEASTSTGAVSVRIECDPIAAVAAARVRPPHLVILDLKLPKLDGLEVLRLLGEDARTKHVPVIAVSGREDVMKTLELGARAAFRKPVSKSAFTAAVAAALAEARPS